MSVRPTLIAFTIKTKNRTEFDKFRVTFSNPNFFQLPPKGKYEYFYTESEEIREVFRLRDPDVKEFVIGETEEVKRTPTSIESQVKENLAEKEVKDENGEGQIIPEDLSELSWPELKSLAAKFTDKKSFKKDEAIEILTKAKGE